MGNEKKQYPEGYFVGIWIVIGMVICAVNSFPLSLATENYTFIGLSPAFGVALGLSIGILVEEKKRKEGRIRPLTEAEEKRKQMFLLIGLVVLLALFLLGLFFYIKF